VHPFNGVLPILPNVADNDTGDIAFFVKEVYWADDLFPPGLGDKPTRDPYWIGKSMLKSALAAEMADQVEYTDARDDLIQALKNELEDWFDGRSPSYFYYDKTWRTLLGMPASFGSGSQLNDHHFHWGYFIYASAIVARHDPAWAKKWSPFIELLIRDASNYDRTDERFPFMRWHDPYAGHGWANGPSLFEEGNNEESSSEDVNYAASLILWGSALGNKEVRDLGIYLYANITHAIEQYWFDIDDEVYPKNFDHTTVAMVWGAGGRYDTWWDPNPSFVHGINFLPITGSMGYLGRHPEYVKKNYGEIVKRNKGEPSPGAIACGCFWPTAMRSGRSSSTKRIRTSRRSSATRARSPTTTSRTWQRLATSTAA
jgi:endoglucanase Acf2